MHNFGPNSPQDNQHQNQHQNSNELPWPNIAIAATVQHQNQQYANHNNNPHHHNNDNPASSSPSDQALNQHHSQNNRQLQYQHGSLHKHSNSSANLSLQSSFASRVDQIIRATLDDSPHSVPVTPKTSNDNRILHNSVDNMLNSSTPSMIFNPNSSSSSSTTTTTTNHLPVSSVSATSSAISFNSLVHGVNGLATSLPSPITTYYHGSTMSSINTLNHNNNTVSSSCNTSNSSSSSSSSSISSGSSSSSSGSNSGSTNSANGGTNTICGIAGSSNNNNNTSAHSGIGNTNTAVSIVSSLSGGNSGGNTLSLKTSAHSASQSALAAAAALQSLNQSQLHRASHHLTSQQQPQRQPSKPPLSREEQSISSMNGNNMPKLGIISTTSSDHHNHNHFALSSSQLDNSDLSNSRSHNQRHIQPPVGGINRPPISWQNDHTSANTSVINTSTSNNNININIHNNSSNNSRLSISSPFSNFTIPNSSLFTNAAAFSNGNNMIGQAGDNNISNKGKNDRFSGNQLNMSQNLDSNFINSLRNNYQWTENFKNSSLPPPMGMVAKQQTNRIAEEIEKSLLSIHIPGTNRLKRVIMLDNSEDLRRSIYCGEFYSKFEEVAIGILTNQVIIPEFSILDYIRLDRLSPQESEKIDNVHKKLGIANLLYLIDPNHQFNNLQHKQHDNQHQNHLNILSESNNLNLNLQQQAFKNLNFIPQPTGLRLESNLGNIDKNSSTSQSPINNPYRSHVDDSSSKIMNAHSRHIQHNFPTSGSIISGNQQMLPPHSNNTNRVPIIAPPQFARSSINSAISSTIHSNIKPPPRSSSAFASTISQESLGINLSGSANLPRQPPAAHQSSSARLNMTGSNPNSAFGHTSSVSSNAQPMIAHMSSKIPKTSRSQNQDSSSITNKFSHEPTVTHRLARDVQVKNPALAGQNGNHNARLELDPLTGLPIHTLVAMKQQDISSKKTSNQQFIGNSIISNSISDTNLMNPPSTIFDRNQKSPMNPPLGSFGGHQNPTNPNSSLFRLPQGQTSTMNSYQPSCLYNKSNYDQNFNEQRSVMVSSASNPPSQINDSNSRQSALISVYQQQLSKSNVKCAPSPSSRAGPNQGLGMPGLFPEHAAPSNGSTIVLSSKTQDLAYDAKTGSHQSPPVQVHERSLSSCEPDMGSSKIKRQKLSPSSLRQDEKLDVIQNKGLESQDNVDKSSLVDKLNLSHLNMLEDIDKVSMVSGIAGHNLSDVGQSKDSHQSNEINDNSEPIIPHESQNSASLCAVSTQQTIFSGDGGSGCTSAVVGSMIISHADDTNFKKQTLAEPVSLHQPAVKDVEVACHEDKNVSKICNNPDNKIGFSQNKSLIPPTSEINTQSVPSKYHKLYTKKAWLKNYGQEDQGISNQLPITSEQTGQSEKQNDLEKSESLIKEEMKTSTVTKVDKENKSKRKKKIKDRHSKKKIPSNRPSRNIKNVVSNSSEISNMSTSDIDSEEASGSKKSFDKNIRQMPKRKVKPNTSRDDRSAIVKTKIDKNSNKKELKKQKGNDEKFLQTCPCYDIVPKNIRCLECQRVRQPSVKSDRGPAARQMAKTNWDDFCRFYEFRKLRYNKQSQIVVAGFSDIDDAKDSDKSIWLPHSNEVPKNISFEIAKYILKNIGSDFCRLVMQERAVLKSYATTIGHGKKIIWKRAVNELRELCDVCATTLFNCHYVCERCGFVVCIDCYKSRSQDKSSERSGCDNLETQTAESNQTSSKISFETNDSNHPPADPQEQSQHGGNKKNRKDNFGWIFCAKNVEHSIEKLTLAQIIAGNCLEDVWSLLHKVNQRLNLGPCQCNQLTLNDDSQDDSKLSEQVAAAIEGCISSLQNDSYEHDKDVLMYLCDGDLLVLLQPHHPNNISHFRRHWIQGKPILVKGVHKHLNMDQWLPQFFAKEFGDYRSDLVDCRNGDIHRHSMKKYWEGFEPRRKTKDDISHQIPAANNEGLSIGPSYYSGSALWRLKDWPPGQDFNEILPSHYRDFMSHLPLKHYTTRCGKLNLAYRLPKGMLKPDLGPKMYCAYGTHEFPERGTTNLHLDISDAINVMIYVSGANAFLLGSESIRDFYDKTISECHIDDAMKKHIIDNKSIPGALWHVFHPSDAHKMREFLNKVADERNISSTNRTDPIHDQTWYLDKVLLDRLQNDYGVKPLPILQCMGDAILIPAGAPHQVKNVQNCIKVANDFVSPENVRYCLQLTNEFRNLPETHMNQEDKLQIKNILYHSIKESLQYIELHDAGKTDATDDSEESGDIE